MATTIWKGQLGFGLVSLPIRLYRAARKERVRFHYVAPAGGASEPEQSIRNAAPAADQPDVPDSEPDEVAPAPPVARVTQTFRSEESQPPVARRELLRGHEVAPERYVTFTQQELRALRPETSSEMQIVRSVRLEEIDPVYFETSYYVVPDQGGERAYSLLYMALRESRYAALATVAMHGREHVVVIRPGAKGLLAHTLFYQDEVHAEGEFTTNISAVQSKELQLAKAFVDAIAGPFSPEEFQDTHRQKLEALISAKLARNEVAPTVAAAKTAAAPPVDILEALKKSLENTQTARVPRREPGRVSEIKPAPRKRRA